METTNTELTLRSVEEIEASSRAEFESLLPGSLDPQARKKAIEFYEKLVSIESKAFRLHDKVKFVQRRRCSQKKYNALSRKLNGKWVDYLIEMRQVEARIAKLTGGMQYQYWKKGTWAGLDEAAEEKMRRKGIRLA